MKRTDIIIIGLAATLAMASCTKDVDMGQEAVVPAGERIELPAIFSVDPGEGDAPFVDPDGTRAPASGIDENSVTDVWMLQFDGTTDASKLITPPQYYSVSGGSATMSLLPTTASCRVVVVANTADPAFEWNLVLGHSTLADACRIYKKIYAESDTYSHSRLTMSAYLDATISSGTPLSFNLKRNVAKLQFSLYNNTAYTVRSVQLCSVPDRLDLTAGATTIAAGDTYPKYGDTRYFDYPENTTAGVVTYYWYVPRNELGTSANSDARLKNRSAKPNATHVRVVTYNAATKQEVVYNFYVGENMINDFNLKPNNRYIINVTINGPGDPTVDERVSNNEVVDRRGKAANCYILNPPRLAGTGATRTYRIYPEQINTFWDPSTSNLYGQGSANAFLGAAPNGKRWWANLIWADAPGLVTTSRTDDGKINLRPVGSYNGSTGFPEYDPTGVDQFFEIVVPADAPPCNFTVGIFHNNLDRNYVQDVNEPTLWSLHFWVTDYDPDVKAAISPTQYAYAARNGSVYRYGYDSRGYTDYSNPWRPGGIYENAVIMDRNLGTFAEYEYYEKTSRGQLYYQYGRKDPFPAPHKLYTFKYTANPTGTGPLGQPTYGEPSVVEVETSIASEVGGPGTDASIENSIHFPLTYYYRNDNLVCDWDKTSEPGAGNNPIYLWKDPNLKGTFSALLLTTGRSLYDPCPYGWQVPNTYTYLDFYCTNSSFNGASEGTVFNYNRGLELVKNGYLYARYWPGTGMADGAIAFPFTGYRNRSIADQMSPDVIVGRTNSSLWESMPPSYSGPINGGMVTLFADVDPNYSYMNVNLSFTSRMDGRAIRCVKVNATL
ncbi:MAG: FimB/Mfa2 family fimbrial subunit [Rikenellaceae bacterium]|jgi:hypothetical protein|nr:FimB/Mfa2 family fimbrial subunit [Rikenellaceae bacterium]